MPLLGLREYLVLALVTLAAQALELLLTPTNITPGEMCQLKVTANGIDPKSLKFDLIAYCHTPQPTTWHALEKDVELKKLNGLFSQEYSLTDKFPDLVPPTSCTVVAAQDWNRPPIGSSNPIHIDAYSNNPASSGTPTPPITSATSTLTPSSTSTPSTETSIYESSMLPSSPAGNVATTPSSNPMSNPPASTTNWTSSQSIPSNLPPSSSTSVIDEMPSGINSSSPPEGKNHVGAIIGGIIGGVSTLILIVALLYVCRRRRSRLYLAKCLDFLRTVKPKAPASNAVTLEKEDWLVQVDGAMAEAAKQTERARSRTENNQKPLYGSNGYYYSDGYQTPHLMEVKAQQADFRNVAMTTSTPSHADEEWESHDHIYDGGYSTLASETGEGSDLEPGLGPWGHPDGLDDSERRSNASSIPDINEMDPEAREKRQDVILERMREVLDGEPQGPGFVVL